MRTAKPPGVARVADPARRAGEADEVGRFEPHFLFERRLWAQGFRLVAGVDEAGRGPLAGPVVAAAVVLPPEAYLPGLDDSKRLTAARREALEPRIKDAAVVWGVAVAGVEEIDQLNIARAAFLAMARAVAALAVAPDHLLVDGFPIPGVPVPQQAIVGGDALCNSIAAASVLAKVYRDRLMAEYDELFPGYGFAVHKGYPTPAHREALRRLGPSPIHRRSFRLL